MIKKILDLFRPSIEPSKPKKNRVNEYIANELCAHFRQLLEDESFWDTMIFPTYFKVVMTPEDYESRRSIFRALIIRVIQEYYKIIREKKEKYPVQGIMPRYWVFQILRSELQEVNLYGDTLSIAPGRIITIAKIEASEPNVHVTQNTGVISVKCGNSVMTHRQRGNLDWNSIQGLEIVSEGEFRYKFDPNMNDDIERIKSNAVSDEAVKLAELIYSKGIEDRIYPVYDDLVHVSGMSDNRSGMAYIKIPGVELVDSALQIKHIGDRKFQVAAFTMAVLNEKSMKISRGGAVHWETLANNSTILLDDNVVLRFRVVR